MIFLPRRHGGAEAFFFLSFSLLRKSRSLAALGMTSVLLGCFALAQQQQQSSPQQSNAPAQQTQTSAGLDREAFTFTSYALQVQITPETHTLAVRGTITLRNDTAQTQKYVALQISSSLDWKSIYVTGPPPPGATVIEGKKYFREAEYITQEFTTDIDHTGAVTEAVISLPEPVAPGGTVDVIVHYGGPIERDAARLERIGTPAEAAQASDWDEITPTATAVRGAGYVVWYPVAMDAASLSVGNQVAETLGFWRQRERNAVMQLGLVREVRVTGRPGRQVNLFSNAGRTVGQLSDDLRAESGGTGVVELFRPLGDVVPTLIAGDYQELSGPNVQVRHFSYSADAAHEWLEQVPPVASFVESWLGKPKREARIVQLASPKAPPFESGGMLLTPLLRSNPPMIRQLLAHLFASVSIDSPRTWIAEGLPYFAQALEIERQQGRAAALEEMTARVPLLVEAENAAKGHEPLTSASDDVFFRVKAAYCWWMLRDMLGDAALKKALAGYKAGDDRDAAYMQHLLESASGKKLDWFFNDWIVRDRGLPEFKIVAVAPREVGANSYTVAVTVENSGDAAAEVPVILYGSLSEQRAKVFVPAHQHASVRIQMTQYPTEATVNDGSVPEMDFSNNSFKIPSRER
jgi:hypothetical protein